MAMGVHSACTRSNGLNGLTEAMPASWLPGSDNACCVTFRLSQTAGLQTAVEDARSRFMSPGTLQGLAAGETACACARTRFSTVARFSVPFLRPALAGRGCPLTNLGMIQSVIT